MRQFLVGFALVFASFGLPAATSSGTKTGPLQAAYTMRLFEEACLNNRSDYGRVSIWARNAGLPELAAAASENLLRGETGKAWNASAPIGEFVIMLTEGGLCSVSARQADAVRIRTLYLELLPTKDDSVKIRKIRDSKTQKAYGEQYSIEYQLVPESGAKKASYSVIYSDSPKAPTQARISLSIQK